jgi:hypothetical protein
MEYSHGDEHGYDHHDCDHRQDDLLPIDGCFFLLTLFTLYHNISFKKQLPDPVAQYQWDLCPSRYQAEIHTVSLYSVTF